MNEIINQFPKQNLLVTIGLSIISLSIYMLFWLRKHTNIINKLSSSNLVPNWWFPLCLSLTILNFGMVIPEILTNDHPRVIELSRLINRIDIVVFIGWVFTVRNGMHFIMNSEKKTKNWYHWFWTLFFNIFYLQYKINYFKKYNQQIGEPVI